jgi:adenylosuccinate lyase
VLRRAASLVDNLRVDADRMLANLWSSYGLVFSQPALLAMVAGGMERDDAYRVVQELARRAWEDGVSFRSLLEKDDRVRLRDEQLDEVFDLTRAVRHAGATFDALAAVEV